MKLYIASIFLFCILFFMVPSIKGQSVDYVELLKDSLANRLDITSNDILFMQYQSLYDVLLSIENPGSSDQLNAQIIFDRFFNSYDMFELHKVETYSNRKYPIILSWNWLSDYQVSFCWLTLPKGWDPDKTYPLYVQLHGLWDVAGDKMEYLAYPFKNSASSFAFEDGILVSPWGLGNKWYIGDSEADIFLCVETVKQYFHIDSSRQYLSGHSMGGFGAWHIGHRFVDEWAALGIHAGALGYNRYTDLSPSVINRLSIMPVYFVVGTDDHLLTINQEVYEMLSEAGNKNLEFVTFPGGHEYRQEDVEAMYLWLRNFTNTSILDNTLTNPLLGKLKIYPLPAVDQLTIEYQSVGQDYLRISLLNLAGETIHSLIEKKTGPGNQSISVDLSAVPTGMYVLKIQTKKGILLRKLMVE